MENLGFIFGLISMSFGITFGIFSLIAYTKVTALEKKLKETGVLDKDFNSGGDLPFK